MRKIVVTALSAALGMTLATSAQAQIGQGKTMTLMVPYPAGGISDAFARQIAPVLGKVLGQNVLVENLGGASGGLAAQKLLNTPNDGRMIFQGSPNELILSPLTNPDIKFKPDQFRHITQITHNPLILMTRPDHPATSIDELVAHSKKSEKGVPYGSVGVGSLYHIISDNISKVAGFKSVHIPYKGNAPMMQDLTGGQVDFAILPYLAQFKDLADGKKLKILAWVSKGRGQFLPELPSFGESKTLSNVDQSIWAGIFVRKDTPEPIAKQINEAMAKTMATPELQAAITKLGAVFIETTSLDAAAKFYEAETAKLLTMTKEMEFKL